IDIPGSQNLRETPLVRVPGSPLAPRRASRRGAVGPRLSQAWHLHPGQAVDLGVVYLREDRAVQVRVVGVWAPNQRGIWRLATDLPDPLEALVALYDRRMTLKEQCRATKG